MLNFSQSFLTRPRFLDLEKLPNNRKSTAVKNNLDVTIKKCKICFAEIARGKTHKCLRKNAGKNIANDARNAGERVPGYVVRNLINDFDVDENGNFLLPQLNGKFFKVRVGQKTVRTVTISEVICHKRRARSSKSSFYKTLAFARMGAVPGAY